jgi:hypothetical protein
MRGAFMNSCLTLSSILQTANKWIDSKDFLAEHRVGNAFSRSRKLSFSNLIYFILQWDTGVILKQDRLNN